MKKHHIVLLAGLGSSFFLFRRRFTKWARTLEKRLRRELSGRDDVTIWVLSSDGRREQKALDAIMNDYNDGDLGTVSFAGHSNGARDILFMIKQLFTMGIPVAYAATLDMTLAEHGAEAYGNIEFLDEFHARLERVDFHKSFHKTGSNYRFRKINKSHVAMASDTIVQNSLVNKIVGVFRNAS